MSSSFCHISFHGLLSEERWSFPGKCCLCKCVIAISSVVKPASLVHWKWNITDFGWFFEIHSKCFLLWGGIRRWDICPTVERCYSCKSEARLDLRSIRHAHIAFDLREGQMRAFEEVLIDLILHKLIKCIADSVHLLLFEFDSGLYLKVLLLTLVLKKFSLSDQASNASFSLLSAFIQRGDSVAAIGIVAVRELIRLDKVSLILILIVCLNELTCKWALIGLIVGGIASILGIFIFRSADCRRIVTDCKTGH